MLNSQIFAPLSKARLDLERQLLEAVLEMLNGGLGRKAAFYLEMSRADWSNLCTLSKSEFIASIVATTSASGSREL